MANDIRGTQPTIASSTDQQADDQTQDTRNNTDENLREGRYPDSQDVLTEDEPMQLGQNLPSDIDDSENPLDLTPEEIEGTRYQIPAEDENDIERAANKDTVFEDTVGFEGLDSKTKISTQDKDIIFNGASADTRSGGDSSLLVDTSFDSQEMDTEDPGLPKKGRDDADTDDDTTGQSVDDFDYNADDGVDTAQDLVNE